MTEFKLSLSTKVINQHPEDKVLINAAKILFRDIHKVLLANDTENTIRLIKSNDFDLEGDNFLIRQSQEGILDVIAESSLGVMYGVLAISRECLGIDDSWYFLDSVPPKMDFATVEGEKLTLPNYHVKYRGWFVNDEVMISRWKDRDSQEYVWERIYETLLRFGGNIIIAGTDKNSHLNRKPANAFGLMTAHHHAEPLGAQMFARVYPELEASYLKYPELFQALWQDSINEQKNGKVIWSLGFRGQGDRPFWDDDKSKVWTEKDKADVINEVIKLQYDMVKAADPEAVCAVNIYGELTKMFNEDLLVLPSDVIEIWADNGYGKMVSRRQGNSDPRSPILSSDNKLGNNRGIYYHVAFHDLQASNFLSKLPNSPAFVSNELCKVRQVGMDTLVVTNTGNIKPHILFLREVAKSWLEDYRPRNNNEIFSEYMNYFTDPEQDNIKEAYETLFDCFIQYGQHEDQKAGDEFYTYTIRKIIQSTLRNDHLLEEMEWLTGTATDIDTQVTIVEDLVNTKVADWMSLHERVQLIYKKIQNDVIAERFYNDLVLDVVNHYRGSKALLATISAFKAYRLGSIQQAFIESFNAKKEIEEVLNARKENPSKKWIDFYNNDVFTNMGLTHRMLDSYMQFLRIVGDNHEQYQWERDFLMEPGDSKVMLLSNTHDALSNDYLGTKMQEK